MESKMYFFLVFLISRFTCGLATTEAIPRIKKDNSLFKRYNQAPVEANVTVQYHCNATGHPLPEIVWLAKSCDKYPKCEDETSHPISELMKSEETRTNTEFEIRSTLHFKPNRSSIVQCKAKNSQGTAVISQRFLFSDYGSGTGLVKLENSTESITVGDDVMISCAFSKYFNNDRLVWSYQRNSSNSEKDVFIIPSEEYQVENSTTTYSYRSTLFIPKIQKKHSGKYRCLDCKVDSRKFNFVNLRVLEALPPSILHTNMIHGDLKVILDSTIQLIIQIDGVPSPSVHWYKDGSRLSLSDRIYLIHGHKNLTSLTIENVSPTDEGTYSFIAVNKAGNLTRSQKLLVVTALPEESKYVMVISIAVVWLIAGAVLWITRRQQNKEKKKLEDLLEMHGLQNQYSQCSQITTVDPDIDIEEQIRAIPYKKEYEFPRNKLKLGKVLGSGAFGVVKIAEADGLIKKKVKTTVAVKMTKPHNVEDFSYVKYLVSELKILIYLGKHPNIVNLLGACTEGLTNGEFAIIVEYCQYGNAQEFLQSNKKAQNFIDQIAENGEIDARIGRNSTSCTRISMNIENIPPEIDEGEAGRFIIKTTDLLCWSYQVAQGMEFLSNRKILHMDLAARNVLLTERKIAKICDFGLAKSICHYEEYRSSNTMLPVRWMAIESIRERVFSSQSDVWSFGIVMWEFFTLGVVPYSDLEILSNLHQLLKSGYRLEKPQFATTKIYELMRSCWDRTPSSRPTFTQLSKKLRGLFSESVQPLYVEWKENTREIVHMQGVENQPNISSLCEQSEMMESVIQRPLQSPSRSTSKRHAEDYLEMNAIR